MVTDGWERGRRPFERIECQQRPIRGQMTSRRTNQNPGNISPQFINCNPIHANPPEFCFNDCPQPGVQVITHTAPAKHGDWDPNRDERGWENRVPRVRRNGECLSQMLVTIRHWRYLDTIWLLSSSKLSSRERLGIRSIEMFREELWRKRMCRVVRFTNVLPFILWHPPPDLDCTSNDMRGDLRASLLNAPY